MASIKKAQIKPCVVQFTSITGLDNYAVDSDPEDYAILLTDISRLYDEAIKLYEGHIDKHEGRTFMATFGVPTSHEEDPERSIKSALLLKQKLQAYNKEHGLNLALKVGINLGRVYAGDVGSEIKKEYTVMGDAVNIAARIMEYAQDNQILVNEEIHSITNQIFVYNKPKLYTPQGSSIEIRVFEALAPRTGFIRRRGIEGLTSPLVGRTEEFNIIKEYLDQVLDGKGNTVVMIGEAGVGKSRLIEELFTHSLSCALEQALVVNWCSGYCSPYKETIYLPFIEIIRQICVINNEDREKVVVEKLLEAVNRLAPEQAEDIYPYLATLLNLELEERHQTKVKYLEPKAIKLQTQVAIATLLRNYALEHPCVYVIDDLYLADMPTLEALDFFIQTNIDLPALIFLLSRPERDKPFWKIKERFREQFGVPEINLRRLSHGQTRRISEHLLRIPRLPSVLFNDIIAKSDGNPFFLEEIIKLLIARRLLYKQGDEWRSADQDIDFTIPYTIDAIIRTRFDTMPVGLRGMLEEMSVIGRNFSKRLLKAFSSQWEHLDETADQLVELGFVSTSDQEEYSFNHALVREVIYSSIPEKRRRGLHLKIAETIEALYRDRLADYYELLFEHYSQTSERDKMIDYGLKAGDQQARQYANHEAIIYYLAVLQALPEQAESRLLVLKELGRIHSLIGKNEDALEFFNTALKTCPEGPGQAEIYRMIADTYENISDYQLAIKTYNTALKTLDRDDRIGTASIQTSIAWIHHLKGEDDTATALIDKVMQLIGEETSIRARSCSARAYNILGSIYAAKRQRKKSFEYYSKALKLYEILEDISGQGVIYNNICGYYDSQGDYFGALKSLEKSLEIDLKTGDMLGQAIATYNIGNTYYQLGNFARAEDELNKYLRINAQINNQLGNGYGNWGLGMIRAEQSRYDDAMRFYEKARDLFLKLGSKIMEISVSMSIVELFRLRQEYEEAWSACETIANEAEKLNSESTLYGVKFEQAQIRKAQAGTNKRLSLTYLQHALEMLDEVEKYYAGSEIGAETILELYFNLSNVHYLLGQPEPTLKYARLAADTKKAIIEKLGVDKDALAIFLNRRLFREFTDYCRTIKFKS